MNAFSQELKLTFNGMMAKYKCLIAIRLSLHCRVYVVLWLGGIKVYSPVVRRELSNTDIAPWLFFRSLLTSLSMVATVSCKIIINSIQRGE